MTKLSNVKKGEITDAINLGNSFLILKVNDIRISKIKINEKKELEKLILDKSNSSREINKENYNGKEKLLKI